MLFLLIVFHAGISFMSSELDPESWLFKDQSTHVVFDGLLAFIHTFRHPAFFVISGYVTHQMFRRYSWSEVLNKRIKRLLIPMLSTLLLLGPMVQILLAQLMGVSEVFSLHIIFPPSKDYPFTISTLYVWFLYYLLIFSTAHLLLEKIGLARFLKQVHFNKPWFLPSVIILTIAVLVSLYQWQQNSLFGQYYLLPELASLAGYFVFYLFGIFLGSKKNSLNKLADYGWYFVIIGVGAFVVYSLRGIQILQVDGKTMDFDLVLMISSALATVFFSFGFLGIALRYYNKKNRIITYVSRSSYFLYLIHFPVLLYFLKIGVAQDWNVFGKFFFVLGATCMVTVMLNALWLFLWKNKPPI